MRINEITRQDLEQINQELEHRKVVVRHQLLEEVKRTRAYGDLSENFEYKEAKREKNRNESRIRYLEKIIKNAIIIEENTAPDTVGLYDFVTYKIDDEEELVTMQIVSKMKNDPLASRITKDSPVGKALYGKKVGDKEEVIAPCGKYTVEIIKIEKGHDSKNLPINPY